MAILQDTNRFAFKIGDYFVVTAEQRLEWVIFPNGKTFSKPEKPPQDIKTQDKYNHVWDTFTGITPSDNCGIILIFFNLIQLTNFMKVEFLVRCVLSLSCFRIAVLPP